MFHLQDICKGYLQADNSLFTNIINTKSLQMADKYEKINFQVRARERTKTCRVYHLSALHLQKGRGEEAGKQVEIQAKAVSLQPLFFKAHPNESYR